MNKFLILTFYFSILFPILALDINLWSQSAILVDYDTEQILFEKNKDLKIQPASMTKMVTLYMVYSAIEKGIANKNDLVPISKRADYKNLPKDSSLMFIEEGQKVTLLELMKGLAIPSGNDAAIAVAEYLYGSVENYLVEVNLMIKDLGLSKVSFVDSSGYSDENTITAAQFVEFCIIFLKKYPESLNELFSLDDFTYPNKQNGYTSIGSIKQYNHNPIIKIYPECDGLKTGFINSSGMNISLTAKNDSRRVVAVLTGVKDDIKKDAELKRIYDSIILLNHGLNNYTNVRLDKIKLPSINVLNGNIKSITPIIPYKRFFSLFNEISISYSIKTITAPIEYGTQLGYVYLDQFGSIFKFPIIANNQIYSLN